MSSAFLDALSQRTLLFDGAMGTTLHAHDLDVQRDYCGCENCPEVLLTSRPELIRGIHESFFAAGADCIETDSFGGARHVLAEFGLQDRVEELNRLAAEVGRAAADRFSTASRRRFVAGSIGPGTKLITLGQIGWDDLLASYRAQVRGLLAGGVDVLLIETCQDLLQVKCAVNACADELAAAGRTPDDVPIMVSITIETTGTMLLGTGIEAAVTALAGFPIAVLGLNCATGPTEMTEHVRYLSRFWPRAVSVMPNAGLPVMVEGKAHFPLAPAPFAEAMLKFVEQEGVQIVGGCCGTTPEHISLLREGLDRLSAPKGAAKVRPRPGCTSLYEHVDYRQDNSFLIVGERMNASGSRKFKELLEADDLDGVTALARGQMREGSHVLDLNVDYAGRDNAVDMGRIVQTLVRSVNAPLMLDTTQPATLEAGLKRCGGKCIINSANFEEGDEKFDEICRLAKRYGAALVIGSIDEDKEAAMARTASRKLAVAERGFDRATRVHGLAPHDVFFDPLVLPISTGMEADRRSAIELIEGVRLIARAFPDSQMTCGVSNVSFGLKPAARVVLNSVLLHEMVEAGLTCAIVHASKILPRHRIEDVRWQAALDLIYDRRGERRPPETPPEFDPLQAFMALFSEADVPAATRVVRPKSIDERLRAHIIDGDKEGLEETIAQALARFKPLEIINDHLLDGMKTVGELFASGRMQLPFVLQSAEAMKAAVSLLEPHMDRVQGVSKGSIVLATVKGDVHDIGKNLVDIILSNNGFTVHNIGIKQPLANILTAWRDTGADAIGLSGLLVKSVNVMEENLREMKAEGLRVPVLLGGAALTRHYAEGHLRPLYEGACYYGKDAFEGLRIMDALTAGRAADIDAEIAERLAKRSHAEEVIARSRAEQGRAQDRFAQGKAEATAVAVIVRSDAAIDVPIPAPPFWGTRVVEQVDLDEIYPFINPVALFRGQWQFKKGAMTDAEYEAAVQDHVLPVFERLKAQCRDERILEPRVVYGYFPCNASGNDLIIWDPEAPGVELERFIFPRQQGKKRLCISDFFRPVDSGEVDVVAFHCVTMGPRVSLVARNLFERNDYTEYLYMHGFGVETAEALAELWHKRIRQEMGISGEDAPRIRELFTQHYRGSRYSFGYPACPDMSDQEKLWRLLQPERIGCHLTENHQIDPEQSTSALIVHHPQAKYFNV
ncbi:MAG: methionine synthase [Phycisphaeraceae bacterium]|nr:methionine synthase [Phycisphaeraceae bacterium]MCW5753112.1 methionine synthase [Phycisphaeraceae bacterium]